MTKLQHFVLLLLLAVGAAGQANGLTPQVEGSKAPIVYKPGADVVDLHPDIEATYPALVETWGECDAGTPVITSGRDSMDVHKPNSLHGQGQGSAIDLRGRHLSPGQVACILAVLPRRLPRNSRGQFVLLWEAPDGYRQPRAHFHLGFREPRH